MPDQEISFHRHLKQVNIDETIEKLNDFVEYQIVINENPRDIPE